MSGRWARALLVLAAVVMTSGCAAGAGSVDADGQPSAEDSESAVPSASTPTASTRAVDHVDLGFGGEEEQVTGEWVMGWVPPFPDGDERFVDNWSEDRPSVREIHDGDNGCTVILEVARLAQEEMSEDDRLISDMMLAGNLVASPSTDDIETMAAVATDDALWQEGEAATMDFRVWHGASEEGTVVLAARGFGEMAAGMALAVFCPAGGDAVSEYREFVDDHARIMVRWPEDE